MPPHSQWEQLLSQCHQHQQPRFLGWKKYRPSIHMRPAYRSTCFLFQLTCLLVQSPCFLLLSAWFLIFLLQSQFLAVKSAKFWFSNPKIIKYVSSQLSSKRFFPWDSPCFSWTSPIFPVKHPQLFPSEARLRHVSGAAAQFMGSNNLPGSRITAWTGVRVDYTSDILWVYLYIYTL